MHTDNPDKTHALKNDVFVSPETLDRLTACPDCDLLVPLPKVPENHTLHCPRCRKRIWRRVGSSNQKVLALSISGLLLYLPAIFLPLMTFSSLGFNDSANILESILNFYQNGYFFVSFMILLSAVIFPLLLLSSIFWVSFNLYLNKFPGYLLKLFRTYNHIEEWAMVEVYLLGIMITVIKMRDTSDIAYHSGLFCFVLLVIISIGVSTTIDRRIFWKQLEKCARSTIPAETVFPQASKINAARMGLILCSSCYLLNRGEEGTGCKRCGETLHLRKPKSSSRTLALVITSTIFLVPANILPIMRVDFLGIPERSTIFDGIIYFFQDGSYFIGLIIFTASILVPVFKIVGLSLLLSTSQPCSKKRLRQKTQMFRFIAFIGRWSMLDVFVIALLTVLVDFGFFTSIHAAPAATYFCLVVASTMLAAIAFDPRLIWDKCFNCSLPNTNLTTSALSYPRHGQP